MGLTTADGMDADFKRNAVIRGKLVSLMIRQAQAGYSGGTRVRV